MQQSSMLCQTYRNKNDVSCILYMTGCKSVQGLSSFLQICWRNFRFKISNPIGHDDEFDYALERCAHVQ